MSRKIKKLKELLDSDDELPNNYSEDADVPAYLNDDRFNSQVNFGWLNGMSKDLSPQDVLVSIASHYESSKVNTNKDACDSSPLKNKFICKGVLLQTDVYCLSQIAKNISEKMLLWFYTFLIYRDMQSNYSFLNSCLVDKSFPNFTHIDKYDRSFINKKEQFEIIIV